MNKIWINKEINVFSTHDMAVTTLRQMRQMLLYEIDELYFI